jgi:hypothetical protein
MSRNAYRLVAAGMLGVACSGAFAGSGSASFVSFDEGNEGWVLNGWDVPDAAGGNPGSRLHWNDFIDNFGMEARTDSNAEFIGDFTEKGPVTISIDFRVDYIRFFGIDVTRELTLQLRDYDSFNGADPASVWINLGLLPSQQDGWVTFSADITDVFSSSLPAGWNGAGAEDPNTFEPILPMGRTWTNVLQGVDEVAFSTFVPGFFFGFTNFNLSIDNVRIEAIPSPGTIGLAGLAAMASLRRRRR